jgi:dTDP-4-dehydrorhamnose 3,5-epimerase
VISDFADFHYKCTDYYDPDDEGGLIWNDPDIAIDWPIIQPKLSPKDLINKSFKALMKEV